MDPAVSKENVCVVKWFVSPLSAVNDIG